MMTDLRKAAKMALEYFEGAYGLEDMEIEIKEALRQALAQPEQEPVGYIDRAYGGYAVFTPVKPAAVYPDKTALYTAPPKREWIGLTDEEIIDCSDYPISFGVPISFAKAIEAKLKEKNT